MDSRRGLSARLKLTLSYAGFLLIAGALLLGAVWWFLLLNVQRGTDVIVHSTNVEVLHGRSELARGFAPAAAIAMAFLLVFGLVGGWLLAGRMLAPLRLITDATRKAATGSLSHRIELEGRRDEFGELADAFDSMLARLEAHVAEQQRFAGNASHELRTPLAITQTLLEVAHKDPSRLTAELVERLRDVNGRAIDLTEALLLLSRANHQSFSRERVDLSLIAEEAAETLLPLAEKRGLSIEASGEAAPAIGSHPLLLQLTTNLVHNAVVHNAVVHNAVVHNSAEDGAVWITTAVESGCAVLTVENTGEKLDARMVATLAEPFRRGTERVRSDHAGVGLGLAIVESIARAHGGGLTLAPRDGGGLRAIVRLPPAPPIPPVRADSPDSAGSAVPAA